MAQQKIRTHKGASKRFKVTGSGKLLHRSQKIRHLRSSKSKRQLRSLLQMKEVEGDMAKKLRRLLGRS
ncbi:MAG: 50S ribosomal protein L35 [Weeksellaceae bacterium]